MRLIFFLSFLSFQLTAQIGTGQWRLHVPARKSIDVVTGDGIVYAAFENGLQEYDVSEGESSIWTDVNGLSDITLTCIEYDDAKNALYVGYDNGNFDKIQDNRVTNIPAIKLAQIPGNKRINKIVVHGDFVYLATGFAVVKVDPGKNEVKDTWYPTNGNDPILDLAFRNDSIFALTSSKMYRANVNNFALADPTQWVVDQRLEVLIGSDIYTELEAIGSDLYVVFKTEAYAQDSVFKIKNEGLELVSNEPFSLEIRSIDQTDGKLTLNLADGVIIYNPDFSYFLIANLYPFGGTAFANASSYMNGKLYIADFFMGLVEYTNAAVVSAISFVGPPKNEFYFMDWEKGRLVIAGGGLSQVSPTYSGSGVYLFENESWELRDRDNMSLWTGQDIWDFIAVSINPNNTDQIAVGSYSSLPVSIMDASGQVSQVFTPDNSTLEYTEPGSPLSLVSGLKYDDKGNLWVLNGFVDQPLNVYATDGNWYSFNCGLSAKNKFTKKLVIDYNGNKWFSVDGAGLYGFNDNETTSVTTDDKLVVLNSGPTTGALPSNTVNAIAVDFDNEIWIGTDNGFAVLYNSETSFDASPGDYNAQRIKVEFEGNVEYVLGNTNITDIEVDGANRKWFATANAGIVLLSADGLEVIHQFTTDNSPLISNNILDIKLDHSTGELFIVTDKGLISYRTDATYEDPEYSNVQVFPNPARPDFDGPITIQGIRYNSDVKITDIAGNLIYQTTSNGGTATWNGRTLTGEKVPTGVYLIWTAANEGKGRKVGKVLIVN